MNWIQYLIKFDFILCEYLELLNPFVDENKKYENKLELKILYRHHFKFIIQKPMNQITYVWESIQQYLESKQIKRKMSINLLV